MSAKQTQHIAAQWLARSQTPEWNVADQAALENWLTDPAHKVAYLRIDAAWQRATRLSVLRKPAHGPMRAERPERNSIWPILRKSAAGLVLIAIGAVAWQQSSRPAEETYITAIGGYKIITFEDGTRVQLNTGTVLRVSKNGKERKAWLDKGEAYFEVAHDADRPFTVIANHRKVVDLGTKFVVRQDADELRVSVVEGLVDVEAKGEKPQSLLRPGDILIATADTQTVSQKPLRAIRAGLDWQNGKLFFSRATLAEAAAEFNRYNSRKLIIRDPKAAELTVAGTFQAKNLDAFTDAARDAFGLKVEKTDEKIILSR